MKSHIVELISQTIDFHSLKSDAKAEFRLRTNKSNFKKTFHKEIYVKFRAMISDSIIIIKKRVRKVYVKDDLFSFIIPQNTIALELTIKLKGKDKSLTQVRDYFPKNCKLDFVADLLSTRLTIKHCNDMILDTNGLDHTPPRLDELRIQHQLGPHKSARVLAITHIAMFEAVNAIIGGYESYTNLPKGSNFASIDAAIIQSAHDALVALFPSHAPRLNAILFKHLKEIPDGLPKTQGSAIGSASAKLILKLRENDNSNQPESIIGVDYIPSDAPGQWRKDPISHYNVALGANWSEITPFVIPSASYFRCPPPPDLTSREYEMAFDETKSMGGDGKTTPTVRSLNDTEVGIFWAYDGTPSLCAPPRLYNQIAMTVMQEQGMDTLEMLRVLALLNVGLADSGITSWESKYYYKFWRPVTGIREADLGTGPSSLGDGNAATIGDINWTPLGAPASNLLGESDFTPPFPAYPSGHATFGGYLFQLLRKVFKTDNLKFTIISDELNGITVDNLGFIRPVKPRTYDSFTEAEEENGQSRIYLGIHWSFDKTAGITQGNQVADYVVDHLYKKL
jgi:hypothetical protein